MIAFAVPDNAIHLDRFPVSIGFLVLGYLLTYVGEFANNRAVAQINSSGSTRSSSIIATTLVSFLGSPLCVSAAACNAFGIEIFSAVGIGLLFSGTIGFIAVIVGIICVVRTITRTHQLRSLVSCPSHSIISVEPSDNHETESDCAYDYGRTANRVEQVGAVAHVACW